MFNLAVTTSSSDSFISSGNNVESSGSAVASIVSLVIIISMLAFISLFFFSIWKIYSKAGRSGWEGLIPIYGSYILITKIARRPAWWFVFAFVPILNLVVSLLVWYDVIKAFGKDDGFFVFLVFLPFVALPVLALGNSKYTAPQRLEA